MRAAALAGLLACCACNGGTATPAPGNVVVNPPNPGPSPTPTPPPVAGATDPVISAATSSQSFAAEGRYLLTLGGIEVSYDAVTRNYQVTTPANTTPQVLQRASNHVPQPGNPWTNFVLADGTWFLIRASASFPAPQRYLYTNLAAWGSPANHAMTGTTAFGIPTPSAGMPQQGSLTYSGFLEGVTDETYIEGGETYQGSIEGTVTLTFDASTGVATMTVEPTLGLTLYHPLPAIANIQLVWARGNTGFHQPVPGAPQSLNYPVSGRFTGPAAEELIGGLRLDYVSPIDGRPRSATAAFIAKRN